MKRIITLSASVLIILALVFSHSGCDSSETDESSKNLNAVSAYAKTKLENFVNQQDKNGFDFSYDIYSKTYMAALSYNSEYDESKLETLCNYLSAESIIVTNEKGEVTASFPKCKDKNIADNKDTEVFTGILKWIFNTYDTGVIKDEESGMYSITAGVRRTDADGVIIVTYLTDSYSKVCGDKLAEECGVNTLVARDGSVISSTLDGAEAGKTLSELGIDDSKLSEDSFELTLGDTSYSCKAESVNEYTVISAEIKQ